MPETCWFSFSLQFISEVYVHKYVSVFICIAVKLHDFSFLSSSSPLTKCFRPEIQDIDGNSQCHGLANEKTEDVDDEDEELEEEDDDSLTGKSQDETVSPTAEPRGAFEDEEDEEPTSLTMSFDHTRR